jgi:hypothetical protein
MRRGPRCLDEFPCRSCGQKLLGLTGFALYAAYAAIVRLNGRSSSARLPARRPGCCAPDLWWGGHVARKFFGTGNIFSEREFSRP